MSLVSLQEELMQLHAQREDIFKTIKEAMSFLETTPVGLRGSLVDEEGFPRDDCDLYAVRRARHTVNCAQNDLKAIEATMFEKLEQLHMAKRETTTMEEVVNESKQRDMLAEKKRAIQRCMSAKKPFVRVVSVREGSPAAEAGLTAGHCIVQYGEVDAEVVRSQGLGEMARVTSSHEGKTLQVWVRSHDDSVSEAMELFIVPQRWAGEGLLGCMFEPIALT
ncbi:GRASP55 65 PDZ like domain [Trypanosoma vivax]|nr:proteasome 26S non-ATPase subunit 9 [Trypanosoma vivax]KAH8609130.1 GRASP55 65 PDZ like domain [Trypanosoma vivax]